MTVATWVIAVATVVNVFVSGSLAQATRNSANIARLVYEAANRPYLGPENIKSNKDDLKRAQSIVASIKNFGTAPAEDAMIVWNAYLGGMEAVIPSFPDKPITLFPGQQVQKLALFYGATYDSIMAGTSKLEIIMRLTYKGPARSYAYCEKFEYAPNLNAFVDLGRCE